MAEVDQQKIQRLAIFGARVTMETKLFGKLHTQEVVAPRHDEINYVASTYQRIVEGERASPQDYAGLRGLAHSLIKREHLDAILLAGTDLAFVFTPETTDFPHIDGARAHIKAIMREVAP